MRILILFIGIFFCQFTFSQTDKPNLLYKKAYECITNKNYENSIQLLTKAIQLDSLGNCGTGVNGKAHNELGYAYMQIQNYELSRNFFDKSIELNARNPDPRMNKVTSYILEKELEKAKTELETFIKELPGYPMAYWQKGSILENEGKNNEALLEYRKARAFDRNLNLLPKPIVDKINEKLKNN